MNDALTLFSVRSALLYCKTSSKSGTTGVQELKMSCSLAPVGWMEATWS